MAVFEKDQLINELKSNLENSMTEKNKQTDTGDKRGKDRDSFKYSLTQYDGHNESSSQHAMSDEEPEFAGDLKKVPLTVDTEQGASRLNESRAADKSPNVMGEYKAAIERLTKELMSMNKENTELKVELRKTVERLAAKSKESKELQSSLSQKDEAIEGLKDENIKLCNMINEERIVSIKKLENDLKALGLKHSRLQQDFDELTELKSRYEIKLRETMAVNEDLRRRFVEMMAPNDSRLEMQSQTEELKEKVALLEERLTQLSEVTRKQIGSREADAKRMQEELSESQLFCGKLKERLERALTDLEFYRNVLRNKQ